MTECEGCESENIKIPVMRARERRLEIVWVGLDDVVCVFLFLDRSGLILNIF